MNKRYVPFADKKIKKTMDKEKAEGIAIINGFSDDIKLPTDDQYKKMKDDLSLAYHLELSKNKKRILIAHEIKTHVYSIEKLIEEAKGLNLQVIVEIMTDQDSNIHIQHTIQF